MRRFNHLIFQNVTKLPWPVLLLYYLLIVLDLYTTWLASPDLTFEWNFIVRFFHLDWLGVMLIAFLGAILISLGYMFSLYYAHNQFDWSKYKCTPIIKVIFQNCRIFLVFIIMGYFYKQLSYKFFVIINNYISYLYLKNINNSFTWIMDEYIKIQVANHPYFFLKVKSFFFVFATIYAGFKLKIVKDRVLKLKLSNREINNT